MSTQLSDKALSIAPSATLKLNATVAVMRSEGIDVISLGAGEPDFDTPDHIRRAATAAMEQGKTRYTDVAGIPQLRKAIADFIQKKKDLTYQPNEIIVGSGAKQVLYHGLQAMLNPGDEVIIPAPFWVSYTEMVHMCGGEVVPVYTKAENDFLPTFEQIEAAVTERTKAIIINTPNNPTGAVWPFSLVKGVAELAQKNDFFIISDEIYENLVYDGVEHISPASISPDAFSRTLVVSGFSKAYAMTGWRVGYGSGPRKLIAAMTALQSHATGNANSVAQYAALAALQGPQESVRIMTQIFSMRRKILLDKLKEQGLIAGVLPRGAFYLLLDIRPYIGKDCHGKKIEGDMDFASLLLEHALVAAVPGTPFNAPGFLRISYATNEKQILRAMERIGNFVRSLK